MINELKRIILAETDVVQRLVDTLKKQQELLLGNDVVALEECATELQKISRDIAQIEVERRNILNDQDITQVVENSHDEELYNAHVNMKKVLHLALVNKESNELLIKQGLYFSTRMLSILNPSRDTKTYGSTGKIYK